MKTNQNRMRGLGIGLAGVMVCATTAAWAGGGVQYIRVGDRDGFGLGNGAGLLNFEGDPCNVDGAGPLGPGDYLPDWDGDGDVMHFSGDDFDVRSPSEINNLLVNSAGFVDVGSLGSKFTDLSLSQSYDVTFGVPNDFPDPPSNDRNDVIVRFDFTVGVDDIDPCQLMFFNIIFGDIGGGTVSRLDLMYADGSTESAEIQPINPSVEDGQIRESFIVLDFDDIFTLNGGVYEGFLNVRLVTLPTMPDGDPYFSVDFVELSTEPIFECVGDVNLDSIVNVDDLLLLLAGWGPCADPCSPACRADYDDNGVVNVDDVLLLLGAWGPCV